jgi:hypothetical protein
MANQKYFNWEHLDHLHKHTTITDVDHVLQDSFQVYTQMKIARLQWRIRKKKSEMHRRKGSMSNYSSRRI